MKTKNGIFLDIEESDYKYQYGQYMFYFSSIQYQEKFKNNVKEYIKNENQKLKLKYNVNLVLNTPLLISYYKKIEKRGFKVYDTLNKREISKDIIFNNLCIEG